jgi:hypothetical protein
MSTIGYWIGATLAFAAELGSLAALAFWGFTLPAGTGLRILAGVGVPLVAIVLWWLFAAPQAAYSVPALAVATKVLVQGGAVAALVVTGHPRLAIALGAAVVLGQVLTSLAPQEARPAVS